MKIALGFLALSIVGASLIGCGNGGYDENYKTEVNLTPEQKQKEAELMKDQKPPGGGVPGGNPSQLSVPGKGGH